MIRLTAVSDADLTEIYTCDLQVLASCGANHTENAAQIVDIISANFLVLQEHRATTLTYLGVLLMLRDGQTISARRFAVVVRAMLVAVAISAVGFGVAPIAAADGPYRNCTEAHQDGRWDIPQGDSDYWPAGDRDNDGIACES